MNYSRIQFFVTIFLIGLATASLGLPGDPKDKGKNGIGTPIPKTPQPPLPTPKQIQEKLKNKVDGLNQASLEQIVKERERLTKERFPPPARTALHIWGVDPLRRTEKGSDASEELTVQNAGLFFQKNATAFQSFGGSLSSFSGYASAGINGVPEFTTPQPYVPPTASASDKDAPKSPTLVAVQSGGKSVQGIAAPTDENALKAITELLPTLAWNSGFTLARSKEAAGIVPAAPPPDSNVKEPNQDTSDQALIDAHKLSGREVPEPAPPRLKDWQVIAAKLIEDTKKLEKLNVDIKTKTDEILKDTAKKIEDERKKAGEDLKKLADKGNEGGGGSGGEKGKGAGGKQNPKGDEKNPEDMAKNDDKKGGGKGGGGGGSGGGGGGGDGKGGDVAIGGGGGFAANALPIVPSNSENTSFQGASYSPSSDIKGPDFGKAQRYNIPPFAKASGFSRPQGSEAGKTDSGGAANEGLTLVGSGKAGSGINAQNSALGALAPNAGGNDSGFGNVAGGNKGAGSPLTDVPEPKVEYEKTDDIKDPEKILQFLAASGEDDEEEVNVAKPGSEEPEPTKANLPLQLMPNIEDPMGKKSILGYLGYVRKLCKDYRKELVGVCEKPKPNLQAKTTMVADRAPASVSYSLRPVVAGALLGSGK